MVEQVEEEVLPETKLGVVAGTKFAIRAIAFHLSQPNSRKDILWEIENWTEEYLLEDRFLLLAADQLALNQMVKGLPQADQRKFAKAKNSVMKIQDLAFELLDEIQTIASSTKPRRPRDIRGTPEWAAHRTWMKNYQKQRKAARSVAT